MGEGTTNGQIIDKTPKFIDIRSGIEEGRLLVDKFGPGGTSRCIEHSILPGHLLNLIEFSALAGKHSWKTGVKSGGKYLQHYIDQKLLVVCARKCVCTKCEQARAHPTNLEYVIDKVYGKDDSNQQGGTSTSRAQRKNAADQQLKKMERELQNGTADAPIEIGDDLTDEFCADFTPEKREAKTKRASAVEILKEEDKKNTNVVDLTTPVKNSNSDALLSASKKSREKAPENKRRQRDIRSFFSPGSAAASPDRSATATTVNNTNGSISTSISSSVAASPLSTQKPESCSTNEKRKTPVKIRFESGEKSKINNAGDISKSKTSSPDAGLPPFCPIKDEFDKTTESNGKVEAKSEKQVLTNSLKASPTGSTISTISTGSDGSAKRGRKRLSEESVVPVPTTKRTRVKVEEAVKLSSGSVEKDLSPVTPATLSPSGATQASTGAPHPSTGPIQPSKSTGATQPSTGVQSQQTSRGTKRKAGGAPVVPSHQQQQCEKPQPQSTSSNGVAEPILPSKELIGEQQPRIDPAKRLARLSSSCSSNSVKPRGRPRKSSTTNPIEAALLPKNGKADDASNTLAVSTTRRNALATLPPTNTTANPVVSTKVGVTAKQVSPISPRPLRSPTQKSPGTNSVSPIKPKLRSPPLSPSQTKLEKRTSPVKMEGAAPKTVKARTAAVNGVQHQANLDKTLTIKTSPSTPQKQCLASPTSVRGSTTKTSPVQPPVGSGGLTIQTDAPKPSTVSPLVRQTPPRKIRKEEFVLVPTGFRVKQEPQDRDTEQPRQLENGEQRTSPSKLPPYTVMIKHALAEMNCVGGEGCTKLEILLFILRTYRPKDDIAHVTNKLIHTLDVGIKKGHLLSSASCTPRKLKQSASNTTSPSNTLTSTTFPSSPSGGVVRKLLPQTSDHNSSQNQPPVESQPPKLGRPKKLNLVVKKELNNKKEVSNGVKEERKKIGLTPKRLKEPLASICKAKKMSRKEALRKVWAYIHAKKLLDPQDKSRILCDDKLKKLTRSKAIGSKALLGFVLECMVPL